MQRVGSAAVRVAEDEIARIGRGLLLLVAVAPPDGLETAATAARRIAELRVFDDGEGRMNDDVRESGGDVLVVSQFTLAASLDRGRRPSFDSAAPPKQAREVLEALVAGLRAEGLEVRQGRFGAAMAVELVNDGPVTFVLDF